MDLDIAALLPAGVSGAAAGILIASAAASAFVTAAAGVGGGVVLLAVMAVLMPPAALIPVHGAVQAGANVGRLLVMRRHVRTAPLAAFALGSAAGAALGGVIAVDLPPAWVQAGLGLFILYALWGPMPDLGRAGLWLGGGVSSFLTMFFGATGPFVATIVRRLDLDRLTHVATFSACMGLQHGLKVAVFAVLGFAFAPWAPLIAAMTAGGFAGTLLGRQVLVRLHDRRFHRLLQIVLTVLAARLLWTAAAG